MFDSLILLYLCDNSNKGTHPIVFNFFSNVFLNPPWSVIREFEKFDHEKDLDCGEINPKESSPHHLKVVLVKPSFGIGDFLELES